MPQRTLRLIRGWAAAHVATTFAVLAHVAAGGNWPHPMLYALCVALSGPPCMVLAGLRVQRRALWLAVCASQGLFHVLLVASGSYTSAADSHSHMHASHAVQLHQHSGAHEGLLSGGVLMFVTHGAAALAAGCLLFYGQRVVLHTLAILLMRVAGIAAMRPTPWGVLPVWRLNMGILADVLPLMLARGTAQYRGPPCALSWN